MTKTFTSNAIVITLVSLLFSWLFYSSWDSLISSCLASKWPTTSGTIKQSKVTSYHEVPPGKRSFIPTDEKFDLYLEYIYEVDGKDYAGHRLSFNWRPTRYEHEIEELAMRYNTGNKVVVHYNPKYPEESTLLTDTFTKLYRRIFFEGIALLFVLWNAIKFIKWYRKIKKERPNIEA